MAVAEVAGGLWEGYGVKRGGNSFGRSREPDLKDLAVYLYLQALYITIGTADRNKCSFSLPHGHPKTILLEAPKIQQRITLGLNDLDALHHLRPEEDLLWYIVLHDRRFPYVLIRLGVKDLFPHVSDQPPQAPWTKGELTLP